MILIGIILVMGYFLIFNQPAPVVEPFDDTALRKEISTLDSTSNYWQAEAKASLHIADIEKAKSDSLEKLKPIIKNYYNEKYTFNANADIIQLDSVVRANW